LASTIGSRTPVLLLQLLLLQLLLLQLLLLLILLCLRRVSWWVLERVQAS
jgi:hypothetical protein